MMTVQDFTLLGWTEPHFTQKNGNCICAAGYSRKWNQLLRIYPLPFPLHHDIRRWDELCIPLVRNSRDSRSESWKINYMDRERQAIRTLIKKTGVVAKEREKGWLFQHVSPSIEALNTEQRSLGILKPLSITPAFRPRDLKSETINTDSLFPDDNIQLRHNHLIPTIEIINSDQSKNILQLLEWGCSEFLRKNPFNHEGLWKALNLTNAQYEHLLFVGNNNRHRTAWLAIALLSYKREYASQIEMEFV